MALRVLVLALGLGACLAERTETLGANPIRKIVTLLQNMQKEIEAEGAKEKELFDKFMCFCSGNNGDLTKNAADAKAKIDELDAKIKSEEAEKTQLAQDLIDHKSDREGAKADLAEATTLREKEATEYAAIAADSETNIAAMAKAIPALEKGMGAASFMQMPGSDRLLKIAQDYPNMDSQDRRDVVAFLQQTGDYAPQSGQIVGILKAMKDDMEATLKQAKEDEEKAIAGFGDLKASKNQEVELATEAIESKTVRSGELAVSVVQSKDALEDTQTELADTEKFIQQLASQCATKEKEWAKRSQMRAEEVKAISEAISILNDDDALDVFKKAVPSALMQNSFGFLQRSDSTASRAKKAQAILAHAAAGRKSRQLDLILFTLNSKIKLTAKGKTQGLAGVIKMIDEMVTLLGKDQADDDKTKKFCEAEFEKSGDEQNAAKSKLAGVVASIEEMQESVASLADEIAALQQEIKDLDKAVAQATEQRKEEHADFLESQQLNEAAVQLVGKAKNRLQKFYNPSQYKAEPKTEGTMEDKIVDAGTFAQVQVHRSKRSDSEMDSDSESDVAPPQAPETFGGSYEKSEKSAGVLGLMDMMVKELEGDMKDAEYEEKTSQKDYQELMADSQATRMANVKSITDKNGAKADVEGKLTDAKETKTATDDELSIIATTIQDLHASCDFIVQNYGLRKEARTNEVESLKNAKAILSGADFR